MCWAERWTIGLYRERLHFSHDSCWRYAWLWLWGLERGDCQATFQEVILLETDDRQVHDASQKRLLPRAQDFCIREIGALHARSYHEVARRVCSDRWEESIQRKQGLFLPLILRSATPPLACVDSVRPALHRSLLWHCNSLRHAGEVKLA